MRNLRYCMVVLLMATSCQFKNNRLVGHTYIIKPINEAVRLKLEFSSAQITHTYVSNSDVNVVTYINGVPTKTEDLSYSFNGSTYKMDDEVYNVVFKGDTVVLSVDSAEYLRLVPKN